MAQPTILAVRAVSPKAKEQAQALVTRKLAGAKVGSLREWQQKWNAKHPDAKIAVDGKLGQQTLSAMRSGAYRAGQKARPPAAAASNGRTNPRYGEKGASPLSIGLRRAGEALGGSNPNRPAPNKPQNSSGAWGRWRASRSNPEARAADKRKKDEASAKAAASQKWDPRHHRTEYERALAAERKKRGL